MAALGIQCMFLPTPYGGTSTEWVKNIFSNISSSADPDQNVHHLKNSLVYYNKSIVLKELTPLVGSGQI